MKPVLFHTPEEVAAILRASVKTVRRRIADGSIKAFKEGGRIFVLESQLEEYLKRITQSAFIR